MRMERESSTSAVLFLQGDLDVNNTGELKELLQSLYDKGIKHVLLDFSEVKSIDSRTLGVILLYQKRFKEQPGEITIRNVTSSFIRRSFQMLRLERVIRVE